MRKARGTEETRTSNRPGAAARAKKASSAADQMVVARVLNPMGLRISVAGSSFMVSKKTRAAPETIPGALHLPAEEFEARHEEIPRHHEVVLFCT